VRHLPLVLLTERGSVAAHTPMTLSLEAQMEADATDKPPSWGSSPQLEPSAAWPLCAPHFPYSLHSLITADDEVCLHLCAANKSGDNWFH